MHAVRIYLARSVITPTSQSDTLMNGNSINSKGKRASQDDLVAAIEGRTLALYKLAPQTLC